MEENKKETKTVEKKENKVNGKNNNRMMVLGIAIAVVVVIVIAMCMLFMKDSPKKVVEQAFTELKAGAVAQEMLSGLVQGEDEFNAEAQKLLFEKLEWKILKETQDGDNATVEIEITNKDFKKIMENLIQKIQQAFKSALTGEVSDKTVTNWLLEELGNEEIPTTTLTTTVTLRKENGKWKIVEEENFYYATLPGFEEAINAIK